ncbi:hypothetical protein ACFL2G_04740 [Candidatus Omnitrophota bacterium]
MTKVKKAFFMLICFFLVIISNDIVYSDSSLRVPLISRDRYDEAFDGIGGKFQTTILKADFYISATTHMIEDLLWFAKELAKNGLIYLSELILGIIDKAGRDEYEANLTSTKEEMQKLLRNIRNIGFVRTVRFDFSLLNEEGKKRMMDALLGSQDMEVLDVRYKGLLETHPAETRKNL